MIGTKIEWATDTANAWVGCSKVSPACEHCYAEAMDKRFHAADPHWGKDAPRRMQLDTFLRDVARIRRRAIKTGERPRVFVNSMSDFFEDRRDLDEARLAALDAMRLAPHVDFLLLTKRPDKILEMLDLGRIKAHDTGRYPIAVWLSEWINGNPPNNLWIGTTCENQEWADKRIPELLRVPAAVRFLSVEPMLGPVNLRRWINLPRGARGDFPFGAGTIASPGIHRVSLNQHGARSVMANNGKELGILPEECKDLGLGVDWVICGGESGPCARPIHPDWARSLRDQCAEAGVPFHFKQWGEWFPSEQYDLNTNLPRLSGKTEVFVNKRHGRAVRAASPFSHGGACPGPHDEESMVLVGKRAAGRLLDGVEHNGMPEPPAKKGGGA